VTGRTATDVRLQLRDAIGRQSTANERKDGFDIKAIHRA